MPTSHSGPGASLASTGSSARGAGAPGGGWGGAGAVGGGVAGAGGVGGDVGGDLGGVGGVGGVGGIGDPRISSGGSAGVRTSSGGVGVVLRPPSKRQRDRDLVGGGVRMGVHAPACVHAYLRACGPKMLADGR